MFKGLKQKINQYINDLYFSNCSINSFINWIYL